MFAYLEIVCPAFDLKLIRQFQLVKVTSILISLIFKFLCTCASCNLFNFAKFSRNIIHTTCYFRVREGGGGHTYKMIHPYSWHNKFRSIHNIQHKQGRMLRLFKNAEKDKSFETEQTFQGSLISSLRN